MKSFSDKDLAQLLTGTPATAPPPGLAGRIKADIPSVLGNGFTVLPLFDLHHNWRQRSRSILLVAASVIGAAGLAFLVGREVGGRSAEGDAYSVVLPPRWEIDGARAGQIVSAAATTATADAFFVVVDPSGNTIEGATVIIVHASSGVTRQWTAVTDQFGIASFPSVPAGAYQATTIDGPERRRLGEAMLRLGKTDVSSAPLPRARALGQATLRAGEADVLELQRPGRARS
jgi:hypothetical protein